MNKGCASFLSAVARIVAVICAVLVVITADIALVAVNIERRFFNPEVYKRVLTNQGVYDELPTLLSEQIAEAAAEGGVDAAIIQSLDADDWEVILSELLPPTWVEEQAESVIDQVFAWIDSDQMEMAITISMVEVKARLAGEEGLRAVQRMFDSMPACTEAELAGLAVGPLVGADGPALTCRPPDELMEQLNPIISQSLAEAAAGIPDEQEFTLTQDPENDFRPTLRTIRTISLLSPLIPLALLFVIAILVVRSLRGLLTWWGFPLLVAGLIGIVLALLVIPLQGGVLEAIQTRAGERLPTAALDMFIGVLQRLLSGLALWMGGTSLMVALSGAGMAGIGVYLGARQTAETPKSTLG